jgi:hypothetical protein
LHLQRSKVRSTKGDGFSYLLPPELLTAADDRFVVHKGIEAGTHPRDAVQRLAERGQALHCRVDRPAQRGKLGVSDRIEPSRCNKPGKPSFEGGDQYTSYAGTVPRG